MFKYESLINFTISSKKADNILANGWQINNYPIIALNNIPWPLKTENERTWNFYIHCWDMIDPLLQAYCQNKNIKYIELALRVALDWLNYLNQFMQDISPFAWYDMSVGLRAYRLAYIIDAAQSVKILTPDTLDLLWKSLEQHCTYLADDNNIAFHSNHGLYQIAGQLAMGRRFAEQSLLMAQAYTQAQQRLQKMLIQQFTEEGVHREHSPDYHRMVCNTLTRMVKDNLITDNKTIDFIRRTEEALPWFVLPNGHLCNFGDSNYRKVATSCEDLWTTPAMQFMATQGSKGLPPTTSCQVFPKSGYFIVRKQFSYLAQMAAFHSRTHKHADDLSFIWSDRGGDILVDAGRYGYIGKTKPGSELWQQGYWYSDPNRIYCESTRAHNTLEFDQQDYVRKKAKPYGSAIKRWTQTTDNIFAIETEVKQFNSIRHARVLIFKPSHWLLVYDWYHDNNKLPHNVKQWFHFAPELELLIKRGGYQTSLPTDKQPLNVISLLDNTTASHIYKGEKDPFMQGWWSRAEKEIIPASAFYYEQNNQFTGIFATLFCFSKSLHAGPTTSKANISGRKAQLYWQDECASHSLVIIRAIEGNLDIQYKKKVL